MDEPTIQPDVRYIARQITVVTHGGDYWNTQRIGVFRVTGPDEEPQEEQVGTYHYAYHAKRVPFFHFRQGGQDYALYAEDYTYTKVMRLPECTMIAEEAKDARGFCPVEYYVPTLENKGMFLMGEQYYDEEGSSLHPDQTWGQYYRERDEKVRALSGTFGFVSGCHWGDNMYIQYLDLRRVAEGMLTRDLRFGPISKAPQVPLEKAIDLEEAEDGDDAIVEIATLQVFRLSGKRLDD